MAEVVSKVNTFLRCDSSFHSAIHNHDHNTCHWVSSFPCALGFPSPKVEFVAVKSSSSSSLSKDFFGREIVSAGRESSIAAASGGQMSIRIGKAQRWWEKGVQTNMREITGARDLVDSLLNAEDKLVVVDFFSPGCGGCRALHPKICQFAEMNPDLQFFQVNYEEHKSLCYALNVHVLPFFRFYRGAQGRICSFSCTNATLKKFKDALAKHSPDRCSLGPARGLEEKELLALAANRDLSFNYTTKQEEQVPVLEQEAAPVVAEVESHSNSENIPLPQPLKTPGKAMQDNERVLLDDNQNLLQFPCIS